MRLYQIKVSLVQKKTKETPYEQLKEYIEDYITYVESINDKRLEAAENELNFVQQESIAFNLLRQNILRLEQYGIPQN